VEDHAALHGGLDHLAAMILQRHSVGGDCEASPRRHPTYYQCQFGQEAPQCVHKLF